MKQWFPFTDYDFYAYLTSGMGLIVAVDYTFGGQSLIGLEKWTIAEGVFWTAAAYVIGHVAAGPAALILEHWVARKLLHPPAVLLLGVCKPRFRERVVNILAGGRSYHPLPTTLQCDLLSRIGLNIGKKPVEADVETIFHTAYFLSRTEAVTASRLVLFQNLYGFSRNLTFVGLTTVGLIVAKLYSSPSTQDIWLLVVIAAITIGMFGRFIKFYAAYAAEVLSAHCAISPTSRKDEK